MNISGFELQHTTNSTYCRNAYCSAVIPLCFAGVSPTCSRNRSFTGWRHFSFGEHVCQECIYFLSYTNAKKKVSSTHSIWRHRIGASQRAWMRKSSHLGRRRVLTVEEFVAGHLLPWWMKCIRCGCWRQVTAHTPVGSCNSPYRPDQFTCSLVSQLTENACSWPVDDRSVLVHNRPQDFLASMQIHAWLQGSPTLNVLTPYGVDMSGLSPDSLPGATEESNSSSSQAASDTAIKIVDEQGPFSLVDLKAWERVAFPEMTRFPTLYLAVRNLVLYLWAKDPKHLLTSKSVANHCFVRGLLRIVLCDHWIPHLVEEFTCRGLINMGVCHRDALSNDIVPTDLVSQISSNCPGVPTESAEEKDVPQLRISVLGGLDLTSAVATRQIFNGLLTRTKLVPVERELLESTIGHFSVRFQPVPVTSGSVSSDFGEALKELGIKFAMNAPRHELVDASPPVDCEHSSSHRATSNFDMLHPFTEWHCVSVENPESDRVNGTNETNLFPDRLVLPMHMWSDRIFIHPNHPLRFLEMQTDLQLRPLDKCVLLHPVTNSCGSTTSLQLVSKEVSLRMEFHVEAVLDLVAQLGEQHMKADLGHADEKFCQLSVQDCWDRQDVEVRNRLTDLTRSDLERRLIEFYLAEVEYDLTEPLVTNNPYHLLGHQGTSRLNSWPCPTARLDCLPSYRYAEFTLDEDHGIGSSTDNYDPVVPGHPYLLTSSVPNPGPASTLCALLLSNLFPKTAKVQRITVNRDLHPTIDGSEAVGDTNRSACFASTPRIDHLKGLWTTCTKADSSMITLRSLDGELDSADWVVLTCPAEYLRINFYETSCPTEHFAPESTPSSSGPLILDVPASLKSSLIHESCESDPYNLHQLGPGSEQSQTTVLNGGPACLITVTLFYSHAWWRQGLTKLTSTTTATATSLESMDTDECNAAAAAPAVEWFAILPEDRENRGFCHTFRDVCPHLDQPGVLQTQLFGAAADHWWSKGDALLTANVHRFLKSRWVICDEGDVDSTNAGSVPAVPSPIYSHVARMQHSSRPSSERTAHSSMDPSLSVLDSHGQLMHLKPNAWEELARRAHILIPALVPPSIVRLAETNEAAGFYGLPENVQLTRFPGMDVLTSTVLDGLHVANLVLRCIPGLGSKSMLTGVSFQSKLDSSLQDSSTLLSDSSQLDDSHSVTGASKPSSKTSESAALSARTKRLLRRTYNPGECEKLLEAC